MNQLTEDRVREIVREEMGKEKATAIVAIEKRNKELSKSYRPEQPWGVNLRK